MKQTKHTTTPADGGRTPEAGQPTATCRSTRTYGGLLGAAPYGPIVPMVPVVPIQRQAAPARSAATAAGLPQAAVENLPHSGGAPPKASVAERFAAATGYPLAPAVRIHTGEASRNAADAIHARAFTVGTDIHVGSAGSAADERLMLHEATHTLHQREGAAVAQRQSTPRSGGDLEAEADRVATAALAGETADVHVGGARLIQCDAVDDARQKLSYGAFDWAITDAEAMEALALLVSMPDLAVAVSRLGDRYVFRLLDNLPDGAKSGDGYTRLIVALGPAGVRPYVTSLLSYGVFDWVISDRDVTLVFNVLGVLPANQKEALLIVIDGDARLGRLVSNSNAGHHALHIRPWLATLPRGETATNAQKRLLKTIFDHTANGEIETLRLCVSSRFDLVVGAAIGLSGGNAPMPWDAAGLRRAYPVMEALPAAHVAQNARLSHFGRGGGTGGIAGQYAPLNNEVALLYDSGDIGSRNRSEAGDPLHGVDRFNKVIRHEIGHSVDAQMGWFMGPEPARPERGEWQRYGANHFRCATDMVAGSGGGITSELTAVQRTDVINAMVAAMTNRSAATLRSDIQALAWFAGLADASKDAVLADAALHAVTVGLREPWYTATGGGPQLGAHIYQESYSSSWTRYEHAARARKVSEYQFRDPREWFAEAYAAYYDPDPRGRGARLADRDGNTKRWFDTNVHTLAASR